MQQLDNATNHKQSSKINTTHQSSVDYRLVVERVNQSDEPSRYSSVFQRHAWNISQQNYVEILTDLQIIQCCQWLIYTDMYQLTEHCTGKN